MSKEFLKGIFGESNDRVVGRKDDFISQVFGKQNFKSNSDVIGSKKDISKSISISQLNRIFSK